MAAVPPAPPPAPVTSTKPAAAVDPLADLGLGSDTNPNRRKQPASAVLGKILCFDAEGQRIGQWGGTVCFLSKERGKGPCLVVRKACDTKIGRGSFFNLGGMQKVLGKHTADGNMTLFFNTTPTGLKGKTCSILIEASKEERDRQNLNNMHAILSNVSRWNEIEKNLSAFIRPDARPRSRGDVLQTTDENPDFRLREPQIAPEDEEALGLLNAGDDGGAQDDSAGRAAAEEEEEARLVAEVEQRRRAEQEEALAERRQQEEESMRQKEAEEEAERQRTAEEEAAAQQEAVFERYKTEVEAKGGKLVLGDDGYMYVEPAVEGTVLENVPDFETIQSQVLQEFSQQQGGAQLTQEQQGQQQQPIIMDQILNSQSNDDTLGETTLDLDAYRRALETQKELRPTTVVQPELEGFDEDSKALAAETAALQAQMGELPDSSGAVEDQGLGFAPRIQQVGDDYEEGFVGLDQTGSFLSPALGGEKALSAAVTTTPLLEDSTNVDASLATSRSKRNRMTLIDEE